jgi:hypothetical protein
MEAAGSYYVGGLAAANARASCPRSSKHTDSHRVALAKSHVSTGRLTHRNLSANSKLLHKHHITHIASQSVLSSVERFPGGLVVGRAVREEVD